MVYFSITYVSYIPGIHGAGIQIVKHNSNSFPIFFLLYDGKLCRVNRWVIWGTVRVIGIVMTKMTESV